MKTIPMIKTDSIPNDGKLHTVWQDGRFEIKAFCGEMGNLSYTLFVGGVSYACSGNIRNLESRIVNL